MTTAKDNQTLTPRPRAGVTKARRAPRPRTSGDMLGMVRRTARAMVRRAAAGDIEALEALRLMAEAVADAEKDAGAAAERGGDDLQRHS